MSEIAVPSVMSVEGRANMIADVVNRIEHVGNPEARRKAVYCEALVQLRAAVVQGFGRVGD